MAATVTNENLGVTTTTSDHTAATETPSDVCWNPPVTAQIPHVNSVSTDKAVEHTSGKTLFQSGNVVRVGEAIMPSDPAHGDIGAGGGVKSHTYRLEARATRGSPNVRAEGKAPARTDDPTTQNHANTTGKMLQVVPPGALDDNPGEFLKRCSYVKSTIKCDHGEETKKTEIDVWRGDKIHVEAERENAKEPDAKPVCAQPVHMKWHVTRSGGVDASGAPMPEMSDDFFGDKLDLPHVWTGPTGTLVMDGKQTLELSKEAKKDYIDQKNTLAQNNATIRGSSRVEGQDTRAAYKTVGERIKATDEGTAPGLNMARALAHDLATLPQFLREWRAHQNPVRVEIVGNACSSGVTYTVRCYPNSKYTFTVPLDGIIAAGKWVHKNFTFIQSLAQLAGLHLEGGKSFQIPGDVAITLEFQWKEGEKEELYEIQREAELGVNGLLFSMGLEAKFPFTNLLAILPGVGVVAARALDWLMARIGADASCGFGFEVSLSAALTFKFNFTEAHGWKWLGGAVKLPIELKFYIFIRVEWKDTLHIEGRAQVVADPALVLEGTKTGLVLKSDDFMVRIGFSGCIHVDTWFYTFDESGTWYPEAWTFRIKSIDICHLIGN